MKITIICILNFLHIAMTAQLTLISKDGGKVLTQNILGHKLANSNGLERKHRDIQNNKKAQDNYADLIKKLRAHKSTSYARTENLSVEDASAVNKYISEFLESQIKKQTQGENELNKKPNNILTVLDLLNAHQQQFTNVNSHQITLPTLSTSVISDPNEYAQVPYIPAIHGIQSTSLPANDITLVSLLSSSYEPPINESTSNVTVETNTKISATTTAAATSIAASLASCRANMLCSLVLAGVITAATVGAVAFPVLVAGPLLSNRKKRSSENFSLHQENIVDIINKYNTNHNPLITAQPTSELHNFLYKQIELKSHNESDKITVNNENGLILKDNFKSNLENEALKNFTKVSDFGSNGEVSRETTARVKFTDNNADEIYNSNNTFYNSRSASRIDENEEHNDESKKANRGFQITSNFTLEQRIPNKNKHNLTTKELTNRLRSNLYEFFSQFDQLRQVLNISINEKKSNNSNLNKEPQNAFELLDYYLNNNLTRVTKTTANNNMNSENIGPVLQNHETFFKAPENPSKSISTTHLFQNLILNNHHHKEFTGTFTTQPSIHSYSVIPTATQEMANEEIPKDLLKLLSDYINIKQSQSTKDNDDSFSVNPLAQLALKIPFTEKPPLANSVVVPSFSTFQTSPAKAAHPNTQSQNIIPINTINNILQNPPASTQNLNFILTKLPALINTPNKQQVQRNPTIINQNQPSQFSPTIFQSYQPSSGSPSVAQVRPPTASLVNTSIQSTSGKPEGLSPEIKKFYGLLCKAILEPDVPLNKVTAYIAEKCLVMRYIGILKA